VNEVLNKPHDINRAVILNDQQNAAIAAAVEWYKGFRSGTHRKQVFFLAGYAGTGKTTVAITIAEQCVGSKLNAEFIAPTGKAASRLRNKGCTHARTMHQFAYNYRGESEDGELVFGAKLSIDGKPQLIICDEASMVGEYDYNNLKSHGVPILALGDIGQLPPVKAVAVFTADHVDFLLDKIERQGGESNIVRASMYVRGNRSLPDREYEDVKVRTRNAPIGELIAHSGEFAQILCSYHRTREEVNKNVRAALGHKDRLPEIGEKIVCKFNQHGFNIMNGEQGIVLGYQTVDTRIETDDCMEPDDDDDGSRVVLRSLTYGTELIAKFNAECFDKNWEVRAAAMKKPGAFDFGYALTVHASQGSEWPSVLVIEESMRGVPYAQLMYTAVTRAQSHLTIYR
jgi:exodeoxyribonuclease-5